MNEVIGVTKQGFLDYMDSIGVKCEDLRIFISDIQQYPYCDLGVCKNAEGKWEKFTHVDEREQVFILRTYDSEEECFDRLRVSIPRILSEHGIKTGS